MAKMREGPSKNAVKQKALRVLKQKKQWVIEESNAKFNVKLIKYFQIWTTSWKPSQSVI
jgi:charged multivesicular body protein 5